MKLFTCVIARDVRPRNKLKQRSFMVERLILFNYSFRQRVDLNTFAYSSDIIMYTV